MDNFLTKPTVLKIVAMLLTILLFVQVNAEREGSAIGSTSIFNERMTDTAHDVPVQLRYDEENLVVGGAPTVVDVTLSGPKSLVVSAINKRDFQVEIVLKNPKIGNQKVLLVVTNLSENLKAKLSLESATLSVQEKITKEFTVTADSKHLEFAEGYSVRSLTVEPRKVKVTGGKDSIKKIATVKAYLRSENKIMNESSQKVEVVALDKSSKKLNLQFEPEEVTVHVKVKSPVKTVPVTAELTGEPAEGYVLDKVTLEKQNVSVYGRASILSEIKAVKLPIDISGLNKTTTITGNLIVPNGLDSISNRTVKATIHIVKETSETLTNIAISPVGLDKKEYSIDYPAGNRVGLTIQGSPAVLKKLKAKDFKVTFDVSELSEGIHKVDLEVDGPENVSWSLSQKNIEIELTKK